MNADEIYNKIISVEFKDDMVTKSLINSKDYSSRVSEIFNLEPQHQVYQCLEKMT